MYRSATFLFVALFYLQSSLNAVDTFHVGVSKVDITPDYPIRLNGFGFRRDESEGVGQKIYAKALVIKNKNESPVILFAVDSLGVRMDLVDRVHKRLNEKHSLPRKNLALTFTHSHCTPKVDGSSDTIFSTPIPKAHQKHITRYTKELEDKLVLAGELAFKNLQPSKLSWGTGSVGFAVNRRTRGGPVDHSLPVLFVESMDNKVQAVFTTYACHCVTLSYNKIHGDWAGSAALALERMFDGAIGLVSIGLGSDSNPSTGVTGGDEKAADRLGLLIANEVKRVFESRKAITPCQVTGTLSTIPLELNPVPTKEQLTEMAAKGGPAGHNAQYQLKKLKSKGKLPTKIDYPVQTIYFTDQLSMIFLGGEVCVDYAIALRKKLDREKVWFHGYANDFCSYIPSERLVKEGGYGGGAEIVYFGLPSTLKGGLESKIVSEVVRQSAAGFRIPPGTRGSAPKTPQQSILQMKVPNGLTVSLVAAEPVIRDPVHIDFGYHGELYVVEMPDYARKVDAKFGGQGVVKRLFDKDGDGEYETQSAFLSGLRFPTGVKAWKNGVLVCDAPDIIYAEDTNNDGVAEKKEVWLSGFATHNPHARVNALCMGLDGWLYGSGGLFGGVIKKRSGETVDLRGRDFRWRPDTDELEPATGVSQQGRARDDWDQWYGCDNGTLLKYYAIEDRFTKRNLDVPSVPTQLSPLRGPSGSTLYPSGELVLFKLSGAPGRPTSVCGVGIYRDQLMGEEFYGNTFSCEPVNQLVHRRKVDYSSGTSIATRAATEANTEFLTSSDQWFRPVQIKTGTDGCLWVVDMYRYVIEHPRWIPDQTKAELNVFAGTDRGRIYRISKKESRKPNSIFDASDMELVEWVSGENGTTRDLAMEYIVWKKRHDLVPKLVEQFAKVSPAGKAQILSVANQLAALDETLILKAMADKSELVQFSALRVAEYHLEKEDVLTAVLEKANHENPFIAKQAYWVLGSFETERTAMYLATMWSKVRQNAELRYAILSSIKGQAKTHWRNLLFDISLHEIDKKYLDTQLLKTVVSGASVKQWQAMFQNLCSDQVDIQKLANDPRFVALTESFPKGRLTPKSREMLQLIFERQLKHVVERKLAASQLTKTLRMLVAIGKNQSLDMSELLVSIDPSYPIEYQAAATKALVSSYPVLWESIVQKLRNCTYQVKSLAVKQWLSSTQGREFLLLLLKENSEIKGWLTNGEKQKWVSVASQAEKELLAHYFAIPKRKATQLLLKEYESATIESGDSAKGKTVFVKNCSGCHRLGNVGFTNGPDLAGLANKTRSSLLESILDPSADIDAKYRSVIIDLVDGKQISGLVKSESSASLSIQINEKESRTILRKDIERLKGSSKSFMPEGLERQIKVESMTNLLSFLMGGHLKRKEFSGNRPGTIVVQSNGATILKATSAEIYGKQIKFEAPFKNIGWWHDQSDYIMWMLNVAKTGQYEIEVTYACDDSAAGNTALIYSSESQVESKIESTKGWANYRSVRSGEIRLNKGRETLSVKSKLPVNGALMDLQSIKLIPKSKASE